MDRLPTYSCFPWICFDKILLPFSCGLHFLHSSIINSTSYIVRLLLCGFCVLTHWEFKNRLKSNNHLHSTIKSNMWTWKHGHTELNDYWNSIFGFNIMASVCVCIKSLFYPSCFRSSENDNKLERNIEFIAEVLARHIFNLTTKVSPLCLRWMNSDYCFLVINFGSHMHL